MIRYNHVTFTTIIVTYYNLHYYVGYYMLLYYSNIDGHYNQKLYIKLVISDVSIDQTGATALLAVPSGPQLSAIYIYIKLLMNIIYLLSPYIITNMNIITILSNYMLLILYFSFSDDLQITYVVCRQTCFHGPLHLVSCLEGREASKAPKKKD